ncbi:MULTISPECIES: hypothetical protein [unclassified Vibrio]|uniref:hypothetical protein n=1 Tax=unclassified Vibrio TaxID=2614977 RepID=UPI00126984B7|nr:MULTISPECIES: hypothetical protein [unclassified Vibrio]MCM5509764.1 hypothetical protein [Vibrio sp. SCSIO 43169]QFT35975.1 hypothetical protein FIU99_06000 [Vibrio sp. THAF64]QGM33875.1 hypothetical protein GGC04_06010 [Vibrio sp. THAF191d]QGN69377.1 hypothetical protein GGC03_06015 [Vibrio sp. THAF191c]
MKKSIFALSVTAFFSASAFASDYIVSDPKVLLPGEDVTSFAMADLNGDGVDELLFVTASGQLKYSQLIGLGNGLIDPNAFESLKNSPGTFEMSISLNGDNYRNTRLTIGSNSRISIHRNRTRTSCSATMRLENDKVTAKASNVAYELTYVSRNYIVGTMTCTSNGIEQSEQVSFTATRLGY